MWYTGLGSLLTILLTEKSSTILFIDSIIVNKLHLYHYKKYRFLRREKTDV